MDVTGNQGSAVAGGFDPVSEIDRAFLGHVSSQQMRNPSQSMDTSIPSVDLQGTLNLVVSHFQVDS